MPRKHDQRDEPGQRRPICLARLRQPGRKERKHKSQRRNRQAKPQVQRQQALCIPPGKRKHIPQSHRREGRQGPQQKQKRRDRARPRQASGTRPKQFDRSPQKQQRNREMHDDGMEPAQKEDEPRSVAALQPKGKNNKRACQKQRNAPYPAFLAHGIR